MRRPCGTWSAGSIGTWCRNISPAPAYQFQCHRMRRHAHRNGFQSSGSRIRHDLLLWEDHCERTRPECVRKFPPRPVFPGSGDLIQGFQIRNVNDQRIIRGPALCFVDPRCSCFIQCIRSQAVHRFCRKRDQTALKQDPPRRIHLLVPDLPGHIK